MKLRYSEAFYSVQGEGKFVGVPSVFLRTFGCNFRCMNFGLGKDEPSRAEKHEAGQRYNQEVKDLLDDGIIAKTEKFNDLPIIHTGCDTYASIYPEFKDFNKLAEVEEVVEHLLSLTPEGKWTMDNGQDIHLIMTGGEPLLAWQRLYVELFEHPRMQDLKNVTFETNTTQVLHDDSLNISTIATELQSHGVVRLSYPLAENLGKMLLSLVWLLIIPLLLIATFILNLLLLIVQILKKLAKLCKHIVMSALSVQYICMPLGGRSEEYVLNVKEVAEVCMEKGWRFTPRLHIHLFGNAWGT